MLYSLIKKTLKHVLGLSRPQPAAAAYNTWAASYDAEPGNLMVILDEQLFTQLLAKIPVKGRHIADIGCGTGRHWAMLYAMEPAGLAGYDVSVSMLGRLKEKYPEAVTQLVSDYRLNGLPGESCDLLISTLALAHFEDIALSFAEWNRVLRPGSDILLTDYHPEALLIGGNITFRSGNRSHAIRHHIYTLEQIRALASALGWEEIQFAEKKIDETMKHFYEAQQALATFHKYNGVPIIYGLHFRKI